MLNNTLTISPSTPSNIICVKCHNPALQENRVEKLPDGGTLIKAIHRDGKECTWAEYDTIEGMMKKDRVVKPKIIVCPACMKRGRINHYYPKKGKKENVGYVVVHEAIGGEWGRKGKVKRVRRCYIKEPNQRDIILKKLGRYIRKI